MTIAQASLFLDRHGWLLPTEGVALKPSPNRDRRQGTPVSLLVIHNISLPPGEFGGPYIEDLFLNQIDYSAHPWFEENLKGLKVSAHFLVRRDGSIVQFVSTDYRAWHAGVSKHAGRERCNDFSIGIEVEGTDTLPYLDAQYVTLGSLVPVLQSRYPLTAVRGHEDIAPDRKTDPGPAFDWKRFAAASEIPLRLLGESAKRTR